jgi:hypothetical protein
MAAEIRQPFRGRLLRDSVLIKDPVVADIVTAAHAVALHRQQADASGRR